MNKTLIFLLILSLSLSRTTGDMPNMTFKHVITSLDKIQNEIINVTSTASHILHGRSWTCHTSQELFKELKAVLDKINEDRLSQPKCNALNRMKQNLNIVIDTLSLQPLKAKIIPTCKWHLKHSKKPLEAYSKILKCFNLSCNVTFKPS